GISLNQARATTIQNVTIRDGLGTRLKVPINARFSAAVFLWRQYHFVLAQADTDPKSEPPSFSLNFGESTITLTDMYQILGNLVNDTIQTILGHSLQQPISLPGKAYRYFQNPSGLPDGSAMYGILLNRMGVAINEFGSCNSECHNPNVSREIEIKQVTITNLVLNPTETILVTNDEGKVQTDFAGSGILIAQAPWWQNQPGGRSNTFVPEASFIQTYDNQVVYDEILLAQVLLQLYATEVRSKAISVKSNISDQV
ncbi:unnamed protein product, partial [marine sediment metagenome]